MTTLIKWGDVIAVVGGGIALAGGTAATADISAGWWVLWAVWAVSAVGVAAARIYRHRLTR